MFRWPISVYYEDTDAGGVVYHSNYLNFFERARTEWLKAMGVSAVPLIHPKKVEVSPVSSTAETIQQA